MEFPTSPLTRCFSRYAPGGKDGAVMTISKALDLDREGRNDAALDAIQRHQHDLLDHDGSLDETVEVFRAEACI